MLTDEDVSLCENLGAWLESRMEETFHVWGVICTRHPVVVLLFGLTVSLACSMGLYFVEFTTDPVKLWSAPHSRARAEKDYFDEKFGPFYRTEQMIIRPTNQKYIRKFDWDLGEYEIYGPVFRKEFLREVLSLQTAVLELKGMTKDGSVVRLKDICFQPMAPDFSDCMVQSALNYFQNNASLLDYRHEDDYGFVDSDYLSHLKSCIEGPTQVADSTPAHLNCLGTYGGPIFPYIAFGGFTPSDNYTGATALVITLVVRNTQDQKELERAQAWEAEFVSFMRNFSNPNMTVSFSSERSIQDEIKRQSQSDIVTIVISYLFMFGYIAFALGQLNVYGNNLWYLLVSSKLMLGVAGVLIVILCVTSSIGIYAFFGVPATMIVLEVQPFLVLAVGVDNIFILVQAYQRDRRPKTEYLEDRIGAICGEVIPSMLLSSMAECFCFFLGALSSMPAVKVFSLYAALAIFFDFFLQVTCFLALFTLDIRREEAGRLEICCCTRLPQKQNENEGVLFGIFKKLYTPLLLKKPIRMAVLVVFLMWLCSSVAVLNKIKIGLEQQLSMPEDSYVLDYFNALNEYLSVGPPVYFVVKGELDYSKPKVQNRICGSSGCNQDSLYGQVYQAAYWRNRSFVAHPVTSWLDDYFDWLRPFGDPPCCRVHLPSMDFCPSTAHNSSCYSCNVTYRSGRPVAEEFYYYLDDFLIDNPGRKCAKGGHAAYAHALYLDRQKKGAVNGNRDYNTISASYFMTYHTIMKNSSDYINALLNARFICDNITKMLNAARNNDSPVEVFPYSIFYVFYEQYLTLVHDAVLQLILSIGAIFLVTTLLLGLDPWSASMVTVTIVMILLDVMGLMYWWNISFNAISLVNLVMSVGISVEFCSHIVRAFTVSVQPTRVERARDALSSMGSSVLSGITLTDCGVIVLAFSHSQIFQVFYFRMYLGIILIGTAHGIIFLPVLLSFIGPSVNKRKLLQRRQNELVARAQLPYQSGDALITQANFEGHFDPNQPTYFHQPHTESA